jgi:hypothetical protein
MCLRDREFFPFCPIFRLTFPFHPCLRVQRSFTASPKSIMVSRRLRRTLYYRRLCSDYGKLPNLKMISGPWRQFVLVDPCRSWWNLIFNQLVPCFLTSTTTFPSCPETLPTARITTPPVWTSTLGLFLRSRHLFSRSLLHQVITPLACYKSNLTYTLQPLHSSDKACPMLRKIRTHRAIPFLRLQQRTPHHTHLIFPDFILRTPASPLQGRP